MAGWFADDLGSRYSAAPARGPRSTASTDDSGLPNSLDPGPTRGTRNPPPRSDIQVTGTPHPRQRTLIKIQNG
jgi:hypothetical protein